MQEYKREKTHLETKLKETSKGASYYNDHLRIIDAWYNQVGRLALITNLRYIYLTGLKVD